VIREIRIGAQEWTVKIVDKNHEKLGGDYGLTDSFTNTIYVAKAHPDAMRDTLLHELMHAMIAMAGVRAEHDIEERIVSALAPMLDMTLDWKFREGLAR
jgi:Zn-dependent peptidase ImmA (M78 family)